MHITGERNQCMYLAGCMDDPDLVQREDCVEIGLPNIASNQDENQNHLAHYLYRPKYGRWVDEWTNGSMDRWTDNFILTHD